MLISQLTKSPIKVRPFGGWCGCQVGGVVVEADNEVENEVQLVEIKVEEFEVEVNEVEVKAEAEHEDEVEIEIAEVY